MGHGLPKSSRNYINRLVRVGHHADLDKTSFTVTHSGYSVIRNKQSDVRSIPKGQPGILGCNPRCKQLNSDAPPSRITNCTRQTSISALSWVVTLWLIFELFVDARAAALSPHKSLCSCAAMWTQSATKAKSNCQQSCKSTLCQQEGWAKIVVFQKTMLPTMWHFSCRLQVNPYYSRDFWRLYLLEPRRDSWCHSLVSVRI